MPKTEQTAEMRQKRLNEKYGEPDAWTVRGPHVDGGTIQKTSTLGFPWVSKQSKLSVQWHRELPSKDALRASEEQKTAAKKKAEGFARALRGG